MSGGRRIDEKFSPARTFGAVAIQPGAVAVAGIDHPIDDHSFQVYGEASENLASKSLSIAQGVHRESESSAKSQTDKIAPIKSNSDEELTFDLEATPIAAVLAPDEEDVDARVEAKLQAQLEQRLQNEILQRLDSERKKQVVIEAVHVDEEHDYIESSSNPLESNLCGCRRKICLLGLAFGLLLLIAAVVVGVILGTKSSSSSSSPNNTKAPVVVPLQAPTSAPTIAQTVRFQALLETIGHEVSHDIRVFNDRSSPQYTTLDWLANVDRAQLDWNATPTTELVERYALAYLYFSTNGKNWKQNLNFLSNMSVCNWNNLTSTPSASSTTNSSFAASVGVMCNTTRVTDIRMGKFIRYFENCWVR